VALDLDNKKRARWIAHEVAPYVEGFKIGPRLLFRCGSSVISDLKPLGKIFLDFKFFDIPSVMLAAVQAAFDIGANYVTVHAHAGEVALKQLAILEQQLQAQRDFRILAVTVLTGFAQETLPLFLRNYSLRFQVESLADLVVRSGLSGLVCSGHEVGQLRARHPEAYLLTPGIRLSSQVSSQKAQDQKRVCTPQDVMKRGASAFVMGRSIYESDHPAQICAELQSELHTLTAAIPTA